MKEREGNQSRVDVTFVGKINAQSSPKVNLLIHDIDVCRGKTSHMDALVLKCRKKLRCVKVYSYQLCILLGIPKSLLYHVSQEFDFELQLLWL